MACQYIIVIEKKVDTALDIDYAGTWSVSCLDSTAILYTFKRACKIPNGDY